MTPAAILFDCDGTLVDSETLSAEVFALMFGELGWQVTAAEVLAAFRGRRMAACLAEMETRFGGSLPPGFEGQFRAESAAAFRTRLREIPGAAELLGAITQPICVASNAPRAKIELALGKTGLDRFFGERIFSAYEVGSWKPDPGLFLHAAAAMGAAPGRCLVVEDSAPGVAAARAAGMPVVALLHEDAPAWLPAGVPAIRALSDLPAFL